MASGTNPGRTSDEVEALLDIEWVHAVAPGAAIRVYIGDGASAAVDPLVDAMQRAVTDNACGAISVSYGYCGASAAFFNTTLDSIFAQAAAQGQSVFISSGDQGAADIVINGAGTACVVGSARHVSEMASDPHVIAVGGSAFTPTYDVSHNDLGSTAERVWNDSTGAGGGGASAVFGKPAWQVAGTPADAKRDIPDVALGSSPISPGFYWGDDTGLAGQAAMNCCVGGTSIAAPMWAGLAKLIAQSTGGRLGNMNPRIYALGALHDASVSGLRDVTLGNNNFSGVSGFAAVAGYDQSTGWGSADMAALTAAYPVSTATPTPSPTPTPTTTPTATPSSTPTATPAPTPTASPTATPTPASTPTSTPTPTPTATPSPTANPATWSPRTVLFGPHKVGTFTVPKMISIGNPLKSTAALIIGSISMTSGNFVVDSATTTCVSGASIARGAHCRVGVRFAPSVQGLLAGSLIVTDSSSNGPHVVALHGRGM
jgi:subtilase family serine protease